MRFHDFKSLLVADLRARVRNGELTERGLAKTVGISQPHMHNILKGARILSPEIGDLILRKLDISLLDLINPDHITRPISLDNLPPGGFAMVSVLNGRLGPGQPWPTEFSSSERFPVSYARLAGMLHPVVVRTSRDEQMEPVFGANDLALLDQSVAARTAIHADSLYVLKRGESGIVRRLRLVANSLYIVTERGLHRPAEWERISIANIDVSHIVRARVTFLAPEMEWKRTA